MLRDGTNGETVITLMPETKDVSKGGTGKGMIGGTTKQGKNEVTKGGTTEVAKGETNNETIGGTSKQTISGEDEEVIRGTNGQMNRGTLAQREIEQKTGKQPSQKLYIHSQLIGESQSVEK